MASSSNAPLIAYFLVFNLLGAVFLLALFVSADEQCPTYIDAAACEFDDNLRNMAGDCCIAVNKFLKDETPSEEETYPCCTVITAQTQTPTCFCSMAQPLSSNSTDLEILLVKMEGACNIHGVALQCPAIPLVTIVNALTNLCLQANRNIPWLDKCVTGKTEQKWTLELDGSIRTQQGRGMCLTSNDDVAGSQILILPCRPDLSRQRWEYSEKDGTIAYSNNKNLVIGIYHQDASAHHLLIWNRNGQRSQKWSLKKLGNNGMILIE